MQETENKINEVNKKNNKVKIILFVSLIILFFSLLLAAMLFYYNSYISNLNLSQNNTNNNQIENVDLLPKFTETNKNEDGTNQEIKFETGGVIDNLNEIDKYKKDEEAIKGAKLLTIENNSVSDYALAIKQIASSSDKNDRQFIIRYFLKNSGEFIDYDLTNKKKEVLNIEKQENVENIKFSKNGEYVVLQKYDGENILSKLLFIQTNTFYNLDKNLNSLDFFINNNLIYGYVSGDGYSVNVMDIKTKKVKEIAKLPMTQWSLEADLSGNIRAFVKPSGEAEGISVLINQKNGLIQNEIKPIRGMTVKQTSDKKYLLLTEGGLGLNNLLFMNKSTQDIFSLNTNTFLEKCAKDLLKSGVICAVPERLDKGLFYPDSWYKGQINTKDKLVYNSLISTSTKLIYNFANDFSVENITFSPKGLYFQDSKNKGLYTLE